MTSSVISEVLLCLIWKLIRNGSTAPPSLAAEKAELESIANDPKEIESRFFDQLSFGTAGLRGTMCTGLHQMNVHVIRHATQAFAEVIKAEGAAACATGRGNLL